MMQEMKRKKKGSLLIPILCIIVGFLIGILCSMLFLNKGDNNMGTEEQAVELVDTYKEMLEQESFEIKTPYINLYYPKKWEKQIRIEQVDEEVYSVEFYAKAGDEKEVHIFDIEFGGKEGSALGTIKAEDEEEVAINVVSYEFEPDNNWTDEETSEIYMMLEDINYIIGMLQKEEGFVSEI